MKETVLLQKNDTLKIEDNKIQIELDSDSTIGTDGPVTWKIPLDISPVSVCEDDLEISWELDYDLASAGVVLLAVRKRGPMLHVTLINLGQSALTIEEGCTLMSGTASAKVGLKAVNVNGANKDVVLV